MLDQVSAMLAISAAVFLLSLLLLLLVMFLPSLDIINTTEKKGWMLFSVCVESSVTVCASSSFLISLSICHNFLQHQSSVVSVVPSVQILLFSSPTSSYHHLYAHSFPHD